MKSILFVCFCGIMTYQVCGTMKGIKPKAGQKGVVLFGVSTRGYGAGVAAFFASLKSNQNDLVKKVTAFKVPEITIR